MVRSDVKTRHVSESPVRPSFAAGDELPWDVEAASLRVARNTFVANTSPSALVETDVTSTFTGNLIAFDGSAGGPLHLHRPEIVAHVVKRLKDKKQQERERMTEAMRRLEELLQDHRPVPQ